MLVKNVTHSTLAAMLLSLSTSSGAAQANSLSVNITGFDTDEGTTMVAIYDTEESYNGGGTALISLMQQRTGSDHRFSFHNLPDGFYAVRVFHDSNNNGELDTNLVGIPSEPYGFSNNAGSFGPASFEDAKVEVNDATQINIKLR